MQQGKAIPIVWTDNPKRITAMFTSEREGRISVYVLGVKISFNITEDENAEAVRETIGELLAGKPIGETEQLIAERFNIERPT